MIIPPWLHSAILLTNILLLFGILGVLSALFFNIMLSSNHKTIVGAEHILKQSEGFRNKLMVSVAWYTNKIMGLSVSVLFIPVQILESTFSLNFIRTVKFEFNCL